MSTAICPDSVTPTWNETFAFPVRERTTEVRIVLEHHRTMKNQFLGKFQGIVSDYWGPHDEQVGSVCLDLLRCCAWGVMSPC
jgi:hypothetical protein